MKQIELVLTGKQIRLFLKVKEAGYSFWIEDFIKDKKNLPDEKSVSKSVSEADYDDAYKMAWECLNDENNGLTKDEVAGLREIIEKMVEEKYNTEKHADDCFE